MQIVDIPTTYAIIGALYITMPLAILIALARQRTEEIWMWCVGGGLFGVGLVLVGLRAHLHELVTYPLANLLIFTGCVLRNQALLKEQAKGTNWISLILLATGFIVVFEVLRTQLEPQAWRFAWALGVICVLMLSIAFNAFKIAQQEKSDAARWISVAYLIAAVVLIIRILRVLLGHTDPDAITSNFDSLATAGAGLLTAVLGSVAFAGIYLERSVQSTKAALDASARLEERAQLSQQIAQLERRKSLGEMAASIVHELSQPLTAISVNLETFQEQSKKENRKPDLEAQVLADIRRDVTRSKTLLDNIRGYAKNRQRQKKPAELQGVINNVLDLLEHPIKHQKARITVQSTLSEKNRLARIDEVEITQVLLNVLRNALQAVSDAPKKHIAISLFEYQGYICIEIHDSGGGLTQDIMNMIGTPFFSTKQEGLGLGFAISRNIAEQHGGSLTIRNSPDGGATVRLELPA